MKHFSLPALLFSALLLTTACSGGQKQITQNPAYSYLTPGAKIEILGIYPDWVSIRYGTKGVGYVLRNRIDVTETVDPVNVPPYPVMPQSYYAVIDRTLEVKAEKDADSETLEILTPGARVALSR